MDGFIQERPGGWVVGGFATPGRLVLQKSGVETFFALGIHAWSDCFEVFDCGEDSELLGDGEDGGWFCCL